MAMDSTVAGEKVGEVPRPLTCRAIRTKHEICRPCMLCADLWVVSQYWAAAIHCCACLCSSKCPTGSDRLVGRNGTPIASTRLSWMRNGWDETLSERFIDLERVASNL